MLYDFPTDPVNDVLYVIDLGNSDPATIKAIISAFDIMPLYTFLKPFNLEKQNV